jgi:WhiB family redox-sensing transcriptional regulator
MNTLDDDMTLDILSAPIIDEKPWAVFASCRDEQGMTFFPQSKAEEATALAICGICPVRQDCFEHAMETNERFGVWGGKTEKQRRKLRPVAQIPRRPSPA